jgi:hypothetical protein
MQMKTHEVDIDMLQRLQASIDSGGIHIIDMSVVSDGKQVLELFRSLAENVLHELMEDMRLAGCVSRVQGPGIPDGNRLFAWHSNGSISFQLAQLKVGGGASSFNSALY